MAVAGHEPTRPGWDCDTCPDDTPWPCSPARVRLGERYRDSLGLAMLMGHLLDEAAKDLALAVDPRELHERFLAWTRPRRPQ